MVSAVGLFNIQLPFSESKVACAVNRSETLISVGLVVKTRSHSYGMNDGKNLVFATTELQFCPDKTKKKKINVH